MQARAAGTAQPSKGSPQWFDLHFRSWLTRGDVGAHLWDDGWSRRSSFVSCYCGLCPYGSYHVDPLLSFPNPRECHLRVVSSGGGVSLPVTPLSQISFYTNRPLLCSVGLCRLSPALYVGTLPRICILAMNGPAYGRPLSCVGTEVRSTGLNGKQATGVRWK